jgi:mannose/fructose/sorbose-specific phosphotransferase system IIB component
MIVLSRIDDRLIHGQVVVGWVNAVKATHLLVVNDAVAADDTQKSFMQFAVPSHLKVSFCSVSEGIEKLKAGAWTKERLLALFANLEDAVALVKGGVLVKEINVGGLRFARGKREIMKSVFLSDQDLQSLRALSAMGVTVIGKMVPTDSPVDIMKVIQ